MRISLEINNLSKSPVREKFLDKVVKKTLQEADFKFSQKINIGLAFVTPKEIKKINREFRKRNQVTDILSFAEYKNAAALKKAAGKSLRHPEEGGIFLGELILCYDDIREYACRNKIGLKKELANVVSHGVLHLLGMKHGKKMFAIQNKIAHGS